MKKQKIIGGIIVAVIVLGGLGLILRSHCSFCGRYQGIHLGHLLSIRNMEEYRKALEKDKIARVLTRDVDRALANLREALQKEEITLQLNRNKTFYERDRAGREEEGEWKIDRNVLMVRPYGEEYEKYGKILGPGLIRNRGNLMFRSLEELKSCFENSETLREEYPEVIDYAEQICSEHKKH